MDLPRETLRLQIEDANRFSRIAFARDNDRNQDFVAHTRRSVEQGRRVAVLHSNFAQRVLKAGLPL